MSSSITSADTIIMLAIAGVYDAPQPLQEFTADDIFTSEDQELVQGVMGVDGEWTGGRVNNPVIQTIALQADSVSMAVFENWASAQETQNRVYYAQATVQFPALGTKWTCIKGILQRGKRLPDAARVLQGRRWTIGWKAVAPANF